MAVTISYKKIDELKPYEKNARTHSNDQIGFIAKSIQEFGFNNPILIDSNNFVIAGHARLEASKKLGLNTVPTILLDHLNDTQKKAFMLADNRIAMDSGWDSEILKMEFSDLIDANFDISLTGFSQIEIDKLINPDEEFVDDDDDDDLADCALVEDKITKPGDIWLLGNHRLMCGDSTNPDHVKLLMQDKNPNLMITDPPYGVNYDPSWRENQDLGVGKRSKGKVQNDDIVDWRDAYALFTGSVCYVWHAAKYTHIVAQNLCDCDFDIVSQIIWVKQHFVLSRGDYHWQHEPCWYAVKKGHKHNWNGSRDQTTTWNIKNNNSFGNSKKEETFGHGTQKPIECMLRPILNNSKTGEYVYDPFGGSGTTLIAAEKSNRNCLMMEIDPAYCDMIVQRWQKMTAQDAVLESSGSAFNNLVSGNG